jgi:hypothetical protein
VPVIYIKLTDHAAAFSEQLFYAAGIAKNEMLTVALSAIGFGKAVAALLDPPNTDGSPYTQCYRMHILA